MKKKFLSLMMAAAVVATTSVSAFAAEEVDNSVTGETTINNVLDSEEAIHEVKITGKVQDNTGNMPAASFKVTVPTAANFTVNQAGDLVGPTLTVKNEGTQAIKVLAQDFENVGTGAIKVIASEVIANDAKDSGPKTLERTNVSLKLEGDSGKVAYLAAGNNKKGVSEHEDLSDINPQGGVELVTLSAGDSVATIKKIALKGTAGVKEINDPVSDRFKLTLKIKKA